MYYLVWCVIQLIGLWATNYKITAHTEKLLINIFEDVLEILCYFYYSTTTKNRSCLLIGFSCVPKIELCCIDRVCEHTLVRTKAQRYQGCLSSHKQFNNQYVSFG